MSYARFSNAYPLPLAHRRNESAWRAMIPLGAFLLALALAGCTDNKPAATITPEDRVLESSTVLYTIRPYKEPCQREPRDFCMIAETENGEARRLYSNVEGLDFKWGSVATAEVEATKLENTQNGKQRYHYRLTRLITQEPIPAETEFEITVDQQELQSAGSCQFGLQDEVSFTVTDQALCSKLETELQTGQPLRALFAFTGNDANPIYLKEINHPIEPAR
jgi:Domain of unknown function (DUF4377)